MKKLPDWLVVPITMIAITFSSIMVIWSICWTIEKLPWPDWESADDTRAEYYKDRNEELFKENRQLRLDLIDARLK